MAEATTHEAAEVQQRSTGTYIYGLVPADVEVSEDVLGVGDPPGEVRLVRHGEIAALVSEVPLDGRLGTPDDLVAHERLLDATAAEVPVLPLRFGAVMTTPDGVVEELLAPHHDDFLAALNELEGRVEYVVKARYVERAVLSEILAENPEIARLREEIRTQPEELTRQERIDLGQLVEQAIAAKRQADTEALTEDLAALGVLTVERPPSHEHDAAQVAVLIETDRADELEEVVDEFAARSEGRITMRLLGPHAPYDFVATPGEETER
ncbi:GvpL/GvpF family gas vesicle protein [Nonomuraea glycinis]|uniref:GvpL/GvpF family gas vesicle protein n=1 Tax=Nonomuraea glycinis TaxID=2047744 RepID=UPI0033AD7963